MLQNISAMSEPRLWCSGTVGSVSLVVFRWIMEDVFLEVQEDWRRRECGLLVGRGRLMYIGLADDTCLFAKLATVLMKAQALEDAARRMVGLELRLPRCHWKRIQRQGQDLAELRPMPQCTTLREMQQTPPGFSIKVVGAHVQPGGGHHAEFKEVGRVACAAFHVKKASWNTLGQMLSKQRVLHFTVLRAALGRRGRDI